MKHYLDMPVVPARVDEYWMLVFEFMTDTMSTPLTMNYVVKGSWVDNHIELAKHSAEQHGRYKLLNKMELTESEYKRISLELADTAID